MAREQKGRVPRWIGIGGALALMAASTGFALFRSEWDPSIFGSLLQIEFGAAQETEQPTATASDPQGASCAARPEAEMRVLDLVEERVLTPEEGRAYLDSLRAHCGPSAADTFPDASPPLLG